MKLFMSLLASAAVITSMAFAQDTVSDETQTFATTEALPAVQDGSMPADAVANETTEAGGDAVAEVVVPIVALTTLYLILEDVTDDDDDRRVPVSP